MAHQVPTHESFPVIAMGTGAGLTLTQINAGVSLVVLCLSAYAAWLRCKREKRAAEAERQKCRDCRERSLRD